MKSTPLIKINVATRIFTFCRDSARLFDDNGDTEIPIANLPRSLLTHFLANPGVVFSRQQLQEAVWGGKVVSESAIQKQVFIVRNALCDPEGTASIKSIRGAGYRFDAIIESKIPNIPTYPLNNNARMLTQVVSLMPYRSTFTGTRPKAKLYCDVTFSSGRIGGKAENASVRFRLALRRAELHVVVDDANVLKFIPHSLKENAHLPGSDIIVQRKHNGASRVVFDLESGAHGYLNGPVWSDGLRKPLLSYRDTRQITAKEAPELSVLVCCCQEDLIISDIQMVDDDCAAAWETASNNKRLAVECYLRTELIRSGLEAGEFDEPYSHYILADAIAHEEADIDETEI